MDAVDLKPISGGVAKIIDIDFELGRATEGMARAIHCVNPETEEAGDTTPSELFLVSHRPQ